MSGVEPTPRCPPKPGFVTAPPPPAAPPRALLLALVVATRPPVALDGGARWSYEHRPALLLLQSFAANAPTLAGEAPLVLYATDDAEAAELTARLAQAPPWPARFPSPRVRSFQRSLGDVALLDVHGLPEKIKCLAPVDFRSVVDVLRFGSVFRSLKRAYGARQALAELGAAHVLVTDADGFAWKDVSAAAVVAHAQTIWYSDHRGAAAAGGGGAVAAAAERPPLPDTNARARQFCSLHPWAASLRSTAWDDHAARMAIGRDWVAWEEASRELLPAPDADVADDPLLVLEAESFGALWAEVETFWRAPLAEATLVALTTPSSLYKHCVRGDVFFLEVLYRSYLYRHRRHPHHPHHADAAEVAAAAHTAAAAAPASTVGPLGAAAAGRRYHFRNATALIEAALPAVARPRGYHYRHAADATLPSAVDTGRWYHPGPSGFSRLWLHATGADGGAFAAAAHALYAGGGVGKEEPRVAFRHDYGTLGGGGGENVPNAPNASHACAVLAAVLRLPAPAAALQLSGAVPAEALWRECADVLRAAGDTARPHGPFVEVSRGVVPPPSYWKHRGEWAPDFR